MPLCLSALPDAEAYDDYKEADEYGQILEGKMHGFLGGFTRNYKIGSQVSMEHRMKFMDNPRIQPNNEQP
jgi:hypothetical protein